MAKYAMQVEVEAEQFLPDEDKIPKGVTSDGPRSPKNDPRAAWIIIGQNGLTYLQPGDYVITTTTGDQYIMKPELFERDYKLLES